VIVLTLVKERVVVLQQPALPVVVVVVEAHRHRHSYLHLPAASSDVSHLDQDDPHVPIS